MPLNKEHSLVKRLDQDAQNILSDLLQKEVVCLALKELFAKSMGGTHVNMDSTNWAIKRAFLDGQETMLKTLTSIIKD